MTASPTIGCTNALQRLHCIVKWDHYKECIGALDHCKERNLALCCTTTQTAMLPCHLEHMVLVFGTLTKMATVHYYKQHNGAVCCTTAKLVSHPHIAPPQRALSIIVLHQIECSGHSNDTIHH